jgi:hypothetical protein
VINGRRWISTGFSVKEASKVGEKEHISRTLNCKFSHSGNLQNLAPAKTEQVPVVVVVTDNRKLLF